MPPLDQLYYSRDIKDAYYLDTVLNGARYAEARVSGDEPQRRGLLVKEGSLGRIDQSRYTIMSYDETCACITPVKTRNAQHKPTQRDETPQLLTLALSPPYPPLFSPLDGTLRVTTPQDTSVSIQADWTGPAHDAEYEAVLIAPGKPQRHKVHLVTDPNQTHATVTGRLTLNLYYEDSTRAQQAATQSCLLIRSALTPLRLLRHGAPAQCQGLLSETP
ncbi:MAG: hypothetical protein ABW068_15795 [Candidatus Thiodiazotropha sp.]